MTKKTKNPIIVKDKQGKELFRYEYRDPLANINKNKLVSGSYGIVYSRDPEANIVKENKS